MERNKEMLNFDRDMTPEEYLQYLFDNTAENGIVLMPSFSTGTEEPSFSLRCHMDWNYARQEKLLAEFTSFRNTLEALAKLIDKKDICRQPENLTKAQQEVWQTYLSPFEAVANYDKIVNIGLHLDLSEQIRELAQRLADGEPLSVVEMEYLRLNMDVTVSEEEKRLHSKYWEGVTRQCKARLGENDFSRTLIMRARRYWRLLQIKAPKVVVENEGRALAQAFAQYHCCRSVEQIDRAAFVRYLQLSEMDDEELDTLFRPRKENKRKSMAPLFVYLILKEHSSPEKPMRQSDILKKLRGYPYEIQLERKALSRILHGLADSQLTVYTEPKFGSWVE